MDSRKTLNAEITVFLSLIMVLVFSFVGAMVESSTIQISKYYKRGDADVAMNSVFAEYQSSLLEEYGIFALDASYETGAYVESKVLERMEFYGVSDTELSINRVQLLSDNNGAAFYQQISYYIENKYGLDTLQEFSSDTSIWEGQLEAGESFEVESKEVTIQESEESEEAQGQLPEILEMEPSFILDLALPEGMTLSDHNITLSSVVSQRNLNTGYGTFVEVESDSLLKGLVIGEYALEKFQDASSTNSIEAEKPLLYEVEYLLKGKSSDRENLQGVVYDLFLIRAAANYVCLLQSATKQAEVKSLGLVLATLATQPELEPAFSQAITVAWACGESVMDIRNLLSGGKVTLVKSEADWQLSLTGLLTLGAFHNQAEVTSELSSGLSYQDYLRMLLYMENQEEVTMRMLDLIELNLNALYEDENFKVDSCINKLEINCKSTVIGGFTYEFPMYYEYQ